MYLMRSLEVLNLVITYTFLITRCTRLTRKELSDYFAVVSKSRYRHLYNFDIHHYHLYSFCLSYHAQVAAIGVVHVPARGVDAHSVIYSTRVPYTLSCQCTIYNRYDMLDLKKTDLP